MADPIVNFFKSTLVGTYSNSATSLTIATGDGALLPDPSVDGAFNLTIFEGLQVTNSTSFEIVRVTAISGDVLTVTRGAENTTPLTISSSTHSILMSATKKTFDDINTAIENVDLTTLTGVEELTFDTTGDEEFGLPAGTTAQRPASPSAGYMRWNSTDSRIEFYNGTRWAGLSEIGFQSETMEVAQLSVTANDAVAENLAVEVEYLVIAGGGGGGTWAGGGGGGAGGYRSSVSGESSGGGASAESIFEADLSTSYTVTVGAGGSGGTNTASTNGSNSVFSTITSNGGGHGGDTDPVANPSSGGSGGGGGNRTQTGASGTSNQGYGGGDANEVGAYPAGAFGGGGGGASQAGQNATTSIPGDGGDGVSSSITGSAVTRAGGGGGGNHTSGGASGGSGGTGGGGNGGDAVAGTADSGTTNTGSGGGGAGGVTTVSGATSGNGGSGVVILRYPSALSITIGAGLTGSETTVGANKVATITAGTGNVSWS